MAPNFLTYLWVDSGIRSMGVKVNLGEMLSRLSLRCL